MKNFNDLKHRISNKIYLFKTKFMNNCHEGFSLHSAIMRLIMGEL